LEGLEGFFLIPGMIKVSKPKFGVAHHRGDDRVSLYDLDECAGFFSTRGVKRRVLNKRGTSQTPGREVGAFTDQASLYGFIELVRVPAVHINQLIVNGVQPWLDVASSMSAGSMLMVPMNPSRILRATSWATPVSSFMSISPKPHSMPSAIQARSIRPTETFPSWPALDSR